jgi:transposase
MNKYLTISELAKQVDLSNSTCRRYLDSFEEFFLVKGGSRVKKYEVEAATVLKRIRDLYDDGMVTKEIHSILAQEFPIVINSDEQQRGRNDEETELAIVTNDDIDEIKQGLEEQKEFNHLLLEQMKQQHLYYEKKFEELKEQHDFLLSLNNSIEQRKLEYSEHENKTNEHLKDIYKQLGELQQQNPSEKLKNINKQLADQNQMNDLLKNIENQLMELQHNETVNEIAGQVSNLSKQVGEMMVKEIAATQEQKSKKGFLSRFFNKF